MGESTLKEKTSKGLFWGGLSNGVQQLLSALFGIYLARTLSPDDYGLVGMLSIFSMMALALQEGGFVSGLMNRKVICNKDYNAVFWFGALVSAVCYLILFFSAPLIARYFHQPRLVELGRWSFLGIILAGLGTSQRAYLQKRLMIREMAIVGISSVALSGLMGIYMAWKGFGCWTLVVQALLFSLLTTVGYWVFSRWHPTFRIDFQPVKEMLGYSVKLLITNFLWILNTRVLSVVIGRYYTAEQVGYYSQADKWSAMGSNTLNGMVNSVAHPVLVTVVDEKERQLRVFRKLMRFTAFIAFPAMFGLAFITPEFILVILTEKWADSIPLMQIICCAGAFTPVMYICINLLLSWGRSNQYMWANIALSAAILLSVYLLYPWGITAMVAGISVVNALWLFVWYCFVRKAIGYSFPELLGDLLPFLGVTLLVLGATHLLVGGIVNLAWRLAAKVVVAGVLYILVMWGTRSVIFRDCLDMLLKRNKETKEA